MSNFVVVIPVGPSRADVRRTSDLLEALRAHEPSADRILLIDDPPHSSWRRSRHARTEAELTRLADGDSRVTILLNPRAGRGNPVLGGLCAAMVAALAWTNEHAPGAWCLRLDTDALVIAPVAEDVERGLESGVGIIGDCDETCDGAKRDFTGWAREIHQHARWLWVWRRPARRGGYVHQALVGRNGVVRKEIRAALAAGYLPGRHCLGGSYVTSAQLISAMAQAGMFDDPSCWLHTRIGDDVMMATRAAALGFSLKELHHVFGMMHVGLPDSPQRLHERGFSIIHSVRNDPRWNEADIRAYFRSVR